VSSLHAHSCRITIPFVSKFNDDKSRLKTPIAGVMFFDKNDYSDLQHESSYGDDGKNEISR